jgi:uncharacterized YccA/Bax inhibitor family protein
MAYKSGNPILSDKSFNYLPAASGRVMTLDGTVNKTMFLLVLLSVFGTTGWIFAKPLAVFILPAMLVAFGIAVILSFKRSWSPALAPVYALLEGTVLGFVSRLYDARFAGIVVQAIGLTLAITLAMLFIYKTRTIKVTQNFRLAVTSATIGIALLYVIDIAMHYFGTSFHFISGGGVIGIGFSLLVVGLAALNLVMDFDFIERGADQGVPKYMEWYSAFGLIVTLVWLYLEMLRLLGKARS